MYRGLLLRTLGARRFGRLASSLTVTGFRKHTHINVHAASATSAAWMSTEAKNKAVPLSLDTISKNVIQAEYAVRGKLVLRAQELVTCVDGVCGCVHMNIHIHIHYQSSTPPHTTHTHDTHSLTHSPRRPSSSSRTRPACPSTRSFGAT
jgi:hypothetical protein